MNWESEILSLMIFNLPCFQDSHPLGPLQCMLFVASPGHLWIKLEKASDVAANLHESSQDAANVGKDGEHEWDADDAKEKTEDAAAECFGRNVAVTDCCDDGEREETSLSEIMLQITHSTLPYILYGGQLMMKSIS